MLNEFKKFLIKGNAVDMAVGFIFGAAFAGVVKSFLDNVIMPPLGMLLGNVDFTDLAYTLKAGTDETEAVVVSYGAFITEAVNFVILGFVIFLMVRTINNLKKKEAAAPAKPSSEVALLTEIRDMMKKGKK